uniref:Thioredoxin domain-containing protein 17 n=2 Tax=Cyprinus carpio TaxID=7962 RepID=A0A8C2IPW8_CYPCA
MTKYEDVAVHGYEEFCKAVSERKGKEIFAYFSGDKDDQGKSWCPDCVKAEPVVRGELSYLPEGSVFIYCQVGDRPYWKDPNNDFKKTLKLTGVPTLLRYGTVKISKCSLMSGLNTFNLYASHKCTTNMNPQCNLEINVNAYNVLSVLSPRSWLKRSVLRQTWFECCSQRINVLSHTA